MAKKTKKVYKSAVTGRFVSRSQTKRNPSKTIVQKVKASKPPQRKRRR